MARWNIEACLEIVRRCEDLYLLIDKKIERTEHIIKKLQSAAVSASDSVERLDVLRGMLGKKVEKLNKAKQEKQKAEVQARMQREQGIMRSIAADTGARGRRGGFETPTKTGGVAGRNATSVMRVQYPRERSVRSIFANNFRNRIGRWKKKEGSYFERVQGCLLMGRVGRICHPVRQSDLQVQMRVL